MPKKVVKIEGSSSTELGGRKTPVKRR